MGRIHEALIKADQEEDIHSEEADHDSKKDTLESEASLPSETETVLFSESEVPQPLETETDPLSEPEASQPLETETDIFSESETSLPLETEIAPLVNRRPSYEYQAIKTKIITRFPDDAIKTIMVTGTSRQCGTTTTAVGFATTLASDCKSRVLLIEANTRLPSFKNFFDLKAGIGLSDLFSYSPEEILPLQTSVSSNLLYVIPAGERKVGANTFFESYRFDGILKKLRKSFDYVIFDAPPAISHDEPKVLGQKVDGVILVSRSGKSRQRVAIRAKNELEEAGANILGVVLNRRKHHIPEWLYQRL